MCKHAKLKHAIFPELWVLKTAKVAFDLNQGY